MRYAKARSLIEDGDLVSVRTSHGLFSRLTKFFTHSEYVHSGVALWLDDGLWLAEINGGANHLVPMSQLEGQEFDVYYPPLDVNRNAVRLAIYERLRVRITYGYVATLMIGLLEWLHLDVFVHWRKLIVCSGYVVSIYEAAGWEEHSYIVSPEKLSKELVFKLAVRL